MSPRSKGQKPGERARDEARPDHHLSFAAGEWDVSDQREPDERFGKTRSDGGAPAEQYVTDEDGDAPQMVNWNDDEPADPRDRVDADADAAELDAEHEGTLESSASPAGMNRGDKPRKSPEREKSNPKPHTKTKAKASTRTSMKSKAKAKKKARR